MSIFGLRPDSLYVKNAQPYNDPMSMVHPLKPSSIDQSDSISEASLSHFREEPTFSQIEKRISEIKKDEQDMTEYVYNYDNLFKQKKLKELSYKYFKDIEDAKAKEQQMAYSYFGLNAQEMEQVREKQKQQIMNDLATKGLSEVDKLNVSRWLGGTMHALTTAGVDPSKMSYGEVVSEGNKLYEERTRSMWAPYSHPLDKGKKPKIMKEMDDALDDYDDTDFRNNVNEVLTYVDSIPDITDKMKYDFKKIIEDIANDESMSNTDKDTEIQSYIKEFLDDVEKYTSDTKKRMGEEGGESKGGEGEGGTGDMSIDQFNIKTGKLLKSLEKLKTDDASKERYIGIVKDIMTRTDLSRNNKYEEIMKYLTATFGAGEVAKFEFPDEETPADMKMINNFVPPPIKPRKPPKNKKESDDEYQKRVDKVMSKHEKDLEAYESKRSLLYGLLVNLKTEYKSIRGSSKKYIFTDRKDGTEYEDSELEQNLKETFKSLGRNAPMPFLKKFLGVK